MPTYEYACAACKHEWEQSQRITEPPIEVCPVCDKPAAHRLISAGTNFILKGGGWYSDLYASPKPPSAPSEKKDEKPDSNGTAAEAETKSESKTKQGSAPSPSATPSPSPSPKADTSSGTAGSSGASPAPSS